MSLIFIDEIAVVGGSEISGLSNVTVQGLTGEPFQDTVMVIGPTVVVAVQDNPNES